MCKSDKYFILASITLVASIFVLEYHFKIGVGMVIIGTMLAGKATAEMLKY